MRVLSFPPHTGAPQPRAADSPTKRVDDQAVRLFQTLDHRVLEGAVQPGHVNLLLVGVITRPEEISGHPVHSQPVGIW